MTARLTIKPPVFDVAQYAPIVLGDYMRMSRDATKIGNSRSVLATAIALQRAHGVRSAAAFLFEAGIAIEVALELLADRSSETVGVGSHARTVYFDFVPLNIRPGSE